MKLLAVGVFTTLVLVSSSIAQPPKVEIFGGYSLERTAPCGTTITGGVGESCGLELGFLTDSTVIRHGWNASITYYLTRFFGVTADFGGHYGPFEATGTTPSLSRYSFLFGPTAVVRLPKITPFAHVLFGPLKETSSLPNLFGSGLNFTKPAILFGGGVDLNVAKRFALRLGQLDFEWQRNPTNGLPNPHGLRASSGIVFKF